jgi:SNF2 family DNA or RNA helicase
VIRAAYGGSAVCPLCREPVTVDSLRQISELQEEEANVEQPNEEHEEKFRSSSKIDAILDEVSKVEGKIVIFSQFVGFLELLQTVLDGAEVSSVKLVGSMTQKQRARVLQEFKEGKTRVLLASVRAAGQGLNLQQAQNVFLSDPWWNREVENQAIDRVHRLGQRKLVRVVRFVTDQTIEAQVLKLQEQKSQMVTMMMSAKSRSELSLQKLDRVKVLLG